MKRPRNWRQWGQYGRKNADGKWEFQASYRDRFMWWWRYEGWIAKIRGRIGGWKMMRAAWADFDKHPEAATEVERLREKTVVAEVHEMPL